MRKRYNKYGEAAVLAASMDINPEKAWEYSVETLFSTQSSKEKGCPKNTFLALCGEGYVKDIPAGQYTLSQKNKEYALEALSLLNKSPNYSKTELWKQVSVNLNLGNKRHNSQMDVVIALWDDNKLIKK